MPMEHLPRVTVVIPVFNACRYLGEAIESILRQSRADFELLVIDDGSSDGSLDVARSYRDERVRLVCHETNLGIARTRNEGVCLARGEYLAFLDHDDVAYPTRLERQVAFLDSRSDHVGVSAWVSWMDGDGRPLSRVKRKPVSPRQIAALAVLQSGLENSASMARTAVLRAFPHNEKYGASSDYDLWARIAKRSKLANLPQVLVRRRLHAQQASTLMADRMRLERQAIHADQLSQLGIAFTPADLEFHGLLRGMGKRSFVPDRSYVDWAERWLHRLKEANRRAMTFPEPEFSRLLSKIWLGVCWHARPTLGSMAWLSSSTFALPPIASRRARKRLQPGDVPV
jgi:glycosyltransferase involved in cell wall biosynthesis